MNYLWLISGGFLLGLGFHLTAKGLFSGSVSHNCTTCIEIPLNRTIVIDSSDEESEIEVSQ